MFFFCCRNPLIFVLIRSARTRGIIHSNLESPSSFDSPCYKRRKHSRSVFGPLLEPGATRYWQYVSVLPRLTLPVNPDA